MSDIKSIGRTGTDAVKRLRKQKLKNGLPFMINAKELATNQCYLEYPNGSIKLINFTHSTKDMDIIRELTSAEADNLRNRFHFSYQK